MCVEWTVVARIKMSKFQALHSVTALQSTQNNGVIQTQREEKREERGVTRVIRNTSEDRPVTRSSAPGDMMQN